MTHKKRVLAKHPNAVYLPVMSTVMSDNPKKGLGVGRVLGCGLGKGHRNDAVALERAAWKSAAENGGIA